MKATFSYRLKMCLELTELLGLHGSAKIFLVRYIVCPYHIEY